MHRYLLLTHELKETNLCCSAYIDESLADYADCAKHIFKETEKVTGNGFSAWSLSLKNDITGCFEEDTKAYPHNSEFGVTNSPIQMTTSRALTTRHVDIEDGDTKEKEKHIRSKTNPVTQK